MLILVLSLLGGYFFLLISVVFSGSSKGVFTVYFLIGNFSEIHISVATEVFK